MTAPYKVPAHEVARRIRRRDAASAAFLSFRHEAEDFWDLIDELAEVSELIKSYAPPPISRRSAHHKPRLKPVVIPISKETLCPSCAIA